MFSRRISPTEAAPTPISAVDARNAMNAANRCSAVSFFEIVEQISQVGRNIGGQHHRRRDNRTSQGTPASLIHASDTAPGRQFHLQTRH